MRAGIRRSASHTLTKGISLIVIGSSLTLSRSAVFSAQPNRNKEFLTIMNNRLKTAAFSFGVAILFGSAVIGCAGTDTVEKTSESHHSETVTTAPAPPAVVMVQPAPMVVVPAPAVVAAPAVSEHSSSNSASSETSPSGSSSSEKSSSSKSTTY
jgi:hypothetical protein